MISIVGGKWTTYRKMSEDVVNAAAVHGQLSYKECNTEELAIHGCMPVSDFTANGYYYGSDRLPISELEKEKPELKDKIHPSLPYTKAQLVWAVQNEMCLTLEDALARRTRALLLDAKAAIECAGEVAKLLAKQLGRDEEWINEQVISFQTIANNYLPLKN